MTGTLGLLVDARRAGIIPSVSEQLDRLEKLRFRVDVATRNHVLALAGEG